MPRLGENGVGRFAALLFILGPPAMPASFVLCTISAMREPGITGRARRAKFKDTPVLPLKN